MKSYRISLCNELDDKQIKKITYINSARTLFKTPPPKDFDENGIPILKFERKKLNII